MKKLVIVNNNMKVGGVQKSLYNLLWSIRGQYDVTLCLFDKNGAYLDKLPPEVKLVTCSGLARYLAVGQGECKGVHRFVRGALALGCRLLGRNRIMKLILGLTKKLPGEYDHAIAFLHNGNMRSLYGGVQEFTLSHVRAGQKIAFLHCDYGSCGADHPWNNRVITHFDRIAACSDGCRRSFEKILPELAEKCVTVPNFHRYEEIKALAAEKVGFQPDALHLISVARLTHEKGIERGIQAVAKAVEAGFDVMLHIVGGGGMEPGLQVLAAELKLEDRVIFHGEQTNPYCYMAAADLFLLTSYHEAAPMVIDEAICLGLPVLTVRTTSSEEMVTARGAGWVCDNEQTALEQALLEILSQKDLLETVKKSLRGQTVDNSSAAKADFSAKTTSIR